MRCSCLLRDEYIQEGDQFVHILLECLHSVQRPGQRRPPDLGQQKHIVSNSGLMGLCIKSMGMGIGYIPVNFHLTDLSFLFPHRTLPNDMNVPFCHSCTCKLTLSLVALPSTVQAHNCCIAHCFSLSKLATPVVYQWVGNMSSDMIGHVVKFYFVWI